MAKYSPQTNYFETSRKISKFYDIFYWIIFILSILITVFKINGIIDYLGVISIVLLAILEGVSQDFKFRAEKIRRKDFIDNSFGTSFVHDSSDEYYDNDEIDYGMKKAVVNLFENSFFSFNVSKVMFKKCVPINVILFTVIILLSVYGFIRNQFAIPILQLFLSRYFLLDIINIYHFRNEVENIFDELKNICDEFYIDHNMSVRKTKFLKTLIEYEVLIAKSNIRLDSKIFNKMNKQLTDEWKNIKGKYLKEEKE